VISIFFRSDRRTIFCSDVIFDEFGYKMTSNTLGMKVQLDVQKTSDEANDKESKGVMSYGIKQEESDEVTGDHVE
jgi:hypothetical protein